MVETVAISAECEDRRWRREELADQLKASGAIEDIFAKIDAGPEIILMHVTARPRRTSTCRFRTSCGQHAPTDSRLLSPRHRVVSGHGLRVHPARGVVRRRQSRRTRPRLLQIARIRALREFNLPWTPGQNPRLGADGAAEPSPSRWERRQGWRDGEVPGPDARLGPAVRVLYGQLELAARHGKFSVLRVYSPKAEDAGSRRWCRGSVAPRITRVCDKEVVHVRRVGEVGVERRASGAAGKEAGHGARGGGHDTGDHLAVAHDGVLLAIILDAIEQGGEPPRRVSCGNSGHDRDSTQVSDTSDIQVTTKSSSTRTRTEPITPH